MKLDSRIIEGKKPLACFDAEEAKQFIGKEGYFAGDLSVYQKLDYFQTWTLQEIRDNKSRCFKDSAMSEWWYYFLPKEWVQEKEPEPVWKPYDLDSWRNDGFMMGSIITFRCAAIPDDNDSPVYTVFYHGKRESPNDLNKSGILLGACWYNFQDLFNEYEIFDDKYEKPGCPKWRPFGYQE